MARSVSPGFSVLGVVGEGRSDPKMSPRPPTLRLSMISAPSEP